MVKAKLTEADKSALIGEVNIVRKLDHRHIVKFYEYYEDASHYYIVSELVKGGELFDRIVEREFYSEKDARDLVKQLAEALGYCHAFNVAHRDMKPENILLSDETNDAIVKIADFGFAKEGGPDGSNMITACGTPNYVARKC